MAVWRFTEGEDIPQDVLPIVGGKGTWLCDVVVYDGDDGVRHIIAKRETYIHIEPDIPGGNVRVGSDKKLFLHSPKFFHLV